MNIARRLTLIVLAVAIPMLLLSGLIVLQLADNQREAQRNSIMYVSRAILSAADAQVGRYIAIAQALAASSALQQDDFAAFREEAERALPGLPGAWVVLVDTRGHQLVNTLLPASQPLPRANAQRLADETRAFESKRVQVEDVIIGMVAEAPVTGVGVGVFRAGEPVYYLTIAVKASAFYELLNSQRLPDGWLAAMIDRRGNYIVRSLDNERLAGKPASQGWRAIMKEEGWFEVRSREGNPLSAANVVSPLSGWAVSVAAYKDVFEAPIRRTILITSSVGFAVTAISVLLAAWAARTITRPIKALETGAEALSRNQPVSFAVTGVAEVDQALEAFAMASRTLIQNAAELKAATAAAEAANAAKSHFLAAASHDLRQPLQALRLFIDILTEELDDRRHQQVAQHASTALAAGEQLLRALLDVSKLDAGTVAVDRRRFAFSEIIPELSAQCDALACQKGLKLTVVSSSAIIDSDPVLLCRLLRNLLDNAIKYTDQGRVLLGCRRLKDGVRIEIWDTGPGITADQQQRIFDDFYQIGNAARDQREGLGIGLAVVRRTAALLGHRITVRSWPGHGSVFAIVTTGCFNSRGATEAAQSLDASQMT